MLYTVCKVEWFVLTIIKQRLLLLLHSRVFYAKKLSVLRRYDSTQVFDHPDSTACNGINGDCITEAFQPISPSYHFSAYLFR